MYRLKNGYDVDFGIYYYNKNAIAISVYKDGEPYYVATVFIEDYPYTFGVVTIKDYSENSGILNIIKEILNQEIGSARTGFVEVPVYTLKDEFIEMAREKLNQMK